MGLSIMKVTFVLMLCAVVFVATDAVFPYPRECSDESGNLFNNGDKAPANTIGLSTYKDCVECTCHKWPPMTDPRRPGPVTCLLVEKASGNRHHAPDRRAMHATINRVNVKDYTVYV